MLQNTFYKASIILISKLDKDTTKENYRSIFLMNIDGKVFNKILVNQFQPYIGSVIYCTQMELILGVQGWSNICKST